MLGIRIWLAAGAVAFAALVGCGGGSGDPAPPPTALPQSVAITTSAAEVGVDQPLASNIGTLPPGLRVSWDFGDGSPASTVLAPTHRYATAGDYTVRLTVSNETGQSVSVERAVSARRMALVGGMSCTGPQQTGWCSKTQFVDVGLPQFIDENTVFRRNETTWIGSDDGGRTFTSRMPSADRTLVSVYAADAKNAWMIWKNTAGERTLSRTRDGGRSWTALRSLATSPIGEYGVKGTGENLLLYQLLSPEGCAQNGTWNLCSIGNNELSLDGGATWTVLPAGVGRSLNNTEVTPSGSVTWNECNFTITGSCASVTAFRAYSRETGVFQIPSIPVNGQNPAGAAARDGDTLVQYVFPLGTNDLVLWRSSDGGRNWTTRVFDRNTFGPPITQGGGLRIMKRRCGTAACELLETSTGGQRYTSIDGGATWSPAPDQPYERLDGFGDVLFDRQGWRVSVDAGATWNPLPVSPLFSYLDDVVRAGNAFWLRQRVTDDGQVYAHYRSVDAGRSWTLQWQPKRTLPGGRVWVFGNGRIVSVASQQVHETNDLASGWDLVGSAPESTSADLTFFDTASGVATYPSGKVYATSDGGRSWAASSVPSWIAQNFPPNSHVGLNPIGGLRAIRDGTFWLAGNREPPPDSAVWRLAPGSLTWERIATSPRTGGFGKLQVVDATRAYLLIGGELGLQRSDDGARTWRTMALPPGMRPGAFYFATADVGWIVGNGGRIIHTRDGGATWSELPSGSTVNFDQVGALDAQTVWVAGVDSAFRPTLLISATGGR